MKKYVIILASIAIATLMISTTTAVPQVQSQSTMEVLNSSEKIHKIIEEKKAMLKEYEQKKIMLDEKTVDSSDERIHKALGVLNEPLGPFLDWLIDLINKLIQFITDLIDFIKELLQIGTLIDLLIEKILELIDLIAQFIQWLIDLFNPDAETTVFNNSNFICKLLSLFSKQHNILQ